MSSLVGRAAPDFLASAVLPDDRIQDDFSLAVLRGRYVVLFFYPLDFSFVCPSEILAFNARLDEFRERGCDVVAVSVDSPYSHLAWKKTPPEQGGIGPVRYPLVSDLTKGIARSYGVLTDEAVALRATFLLDREGVVRHVTVNDMDLGRSVDETLRTLDALRHLEATGEACPANWEKGRKAMVKSPAGVRKYLQEFRLTPS
jgi:peroxiredoxin (alkyl hydroperoxide reductase subunit C)